MSRPRFWPTGAGAARGRAGDLGVVTSAEAITDLPAPVGGVITLQSGVYEIYDDVDLGTVTLATSGAVVIRGRSKALTGFRTNNANALISVTGHTLELQHVFLINTSGRCINYSGEGGNDLTIENCRVTNAQQDLVTGTVGAGGPLGSAAIRECQWLGGVGGIRFAGDIIGIQPTSIAFLGLTGSTERLLEFSTGLSTTADSITDCFFQTTAAGQTGIWIDPSITLSGGGTISRCPIVGPGTKIGGIDPETTLEWRIEGNHRVKDSTHVGVIGFSGNTTATVVSDTTTWLPVTTGTPFALSPGAERMSLVGTPLQDLRMDSAFENKFVARVLVLVEAASPNQDLEFRLRHWDDSAGAFVTLGDILSVEYRSSRVFEALERVVTMNENDFLRVECRNTTSGSVNIIVATLSISATQA